MSFAAKILIPAVLLTWLTTGCYTKMYRSGMEQAGTGPYGQIYNRYDSTAIDTTLTKEDYQGYDTYPSYYDNWSYWGRPRGRTLWGFDFNNFSPDYYWSYYGYYDYYGRSWWDSWYDRGNWWGNPNYGGSGEPAEPPSRQPGDRGRDSGGSYATPPAVQGGGTYVPPTTDPAPQPQPQPPKQGTSPNQKPQPSGSDSNQGSSGSGRGR